MDSVLNAHQILDRYPEFARNPANIDIRLVDVLGAYNKLKYEVEQLKNKKTPEETNNEEAHKLLDTAGVKSSYYIQFRVGYLIQERNNKDEAIARQRAELKQAHALIAQERTEGNQLVQLKADLAASEVRENILKGALTKAQGEVRRELGYRDQTEALRQAKDEIFLLKEEILCIEALAKNSVQTSIGAYGPSSICYTIAEEEKIKQRIGVAYNSGVSDGIRQYKARMYAMAYSAPNQSIFTLGAP